jgi:hypothetical protein
MGVKMSDEDLSLTFDPRYPIPSYPRTSGVHPKIDPRLPRNSDVLQILKKRSIKAEIPNKFNTNE